MRLELENIGGLKGKREFRFEKKLNLIVARNATGLSSIVNGFKILVDQSPPNRVLFKGAARGSSALIVEGKSWRASVRRSPKDVIVVPSDLAAKYPASRLVAVVDEYHPLTYGRLSPEGVAEFLMTICDAKKLEASLQDLKTKIAADEEKMRELEHKLSHCDEGECDRLLERQKELRAREKDLLNQLAKARVGGKSREFLSNLTAQVRKEKERKTQLEKDIARLDETLGVLQKQLEENAKKRRPDTVIDELRGKERALRNAITEINTKLMILDGVLKSAAKECPLCSILKVECGWSSISPEEIMSIFRRSVEILQRERESLTSDHTSAAKAYEGAKSEEERIDKFESETIIQMKQHQNKCNELKARLAVLEKHLSGIGERRLEVRAESREKDDLMRELLTEYGAVKADRVAAEERYDEIVNSPAFKEARANRQRLNKLRHEIEANKEKLHDEEAEFGRKLHAAREVFNKEAAEFVAATGKREIGFRRIHIDGKFRLIIEKEGVELPEDVGELSTSEATSIAVLLAAIGKKVYCPDFPFFVVDTVSTSYELDSLAKCLEYLLSASPYLVVTRPMGGINGIEVLHKLPEKALD